MVYDVIIAGAGITGGMLARELSRYELSVCILEKENDVAMGSTKANSGIVHGGYDPIPGTLKAKLNSEGVELLFQTAEELHVPYIRNGSMVCAFGSEAEHALLDELYEQGQINQIPNLKIITGDEARAMEPRLSKQVSRVLHVPNAGIVSPYELAIAAIGNAMDNGVELKCNFPITAIHKAENIFTVFSENGDIVKGRYFINCAGCNSDKIAALAGDNFFTIIPRAGEYMLLDHAEGKNVKHTLFQCPTSDGKGILISPTVHGNLLAGPTAIQVKNPDCKDTTTPGLSKVKELSSKTVPDVDFRQVITSFTGVRSSEANGDFIIRPSKKTEGLIHAAAIDSPGLTCCVSIARHIVGILQKSGLSCVKKNNWDGTRKDMHAFQKMNDEEKNHYIQSHPAYGKIVCRCESISEGEILDAIRTNPGATDMDGVKRRTRSGMGRCQGGFCSPYVMELIAKERNIPMEEITKSGKNSYMLSGKVSGNP